MKQPAFPFIRKLLYYNQDTKETRTEEEIIEGLSKRELFAGMAMNGILSNPECWTSVFNEAVERKIDLTKGVAISAREYADALIKELESPN